MNEDLTIKAISTYNANLHRGMTAALEAVVAMVLEEAAARVAKNHHKRGCDCLYCHGRKDAAADIRALIPSASQADPPQS